ncbi:hypothetical protein TWF192_007933 [Orbilia oligospora]|nr:hypothetical protein TWF192_007933 [Orbilia oligospora]
MLKFLYTGDYTVVQTEEVPPINNLDSDAISALSSLTMAGGGDDGWVDPEDQLFPSSSELSTTQLNAVTSQDIHRQHRHIVMYALGDQYMIEKLKTYAAKKFQDNMPDKWVPTHWQLLDDIDARTLPTDQALRAPIMELWLKDGLQLFGSEEFRENISRFPAMELEFLRQHVTNISAEVSALQGSVGQSIHQEALGLGFKDGYGNVNISAIAPLPFISMLVEILDFDIGKLLRPRRSP